MGKGNAVVCGMWAWKVGAGKVGGVRSMGGDGDRIWEGGRDKDVSICSPSKHSCHVSSRSKQKFPS